LEIYKEYANY